MKHMNNALFEWQGAELENWTPGVRYTNELPSEFFFDFDGTWLFVGSLLGHIMEVVNFSQGLMVVNTCISGCRHMYLFNEWNWVTTVGSHGISRKAHAESPDKHHLVCDWQRHYQPQPHLRRFVCLPRVSVCSSFPPPILKKKHLKNFTAILCQKKTSNCYHGQRD